MKDRGVEDCKVAQLHRLLAVQGYGALIAIDRRSGQVSACSLNIDSFLGRQATDLIGQQAVAALGAPLFDRCQVDQSVPFGEAVYRDGVALDSGTVCVSSHFTRDHCVLELEFSDGAGPAYSFAERKEFIRALEGAETVEACASVLMREVARLTDFDRVMLYRFLPDWHGEVIAEQNKPGVPGFLGLRFPAGDIPANARRLYTVNLERSVADVEADQVPIIHAEDVPAPDLTWAQLRAVHPVHLTYLSNMGVQASFSLSILSEGKLWGMVACHHLEARRLSMPLRRVCDELTRLAAMQMTSIARINVEREWNSARAAIYEIRGSLYASMLGFPAIEARLGAIQRLFSASGIWQFFNGRDHLHGAAPDAERLAPLKEWVAQLSRTEVSAFGEVPEPFAQVPELVRRASGMLFVPLNDADFILVFRPEQIEEVVWAGRPADPNSPISETDDLKPRTSFLKWAQSVRGRAQPWSPVEVESARVFRQELIGYLQSCKVERQAHSDPLTGLANRLLFDQELERTVEEVTQLGGEFAVLMIDLDNFKPVNDTLGHAAGDELLIQVAQRLTAMVRTEDTVARLGGDEFAVILRHVTSAANAEQIAARMVDDVGRPFQVLGDTVQIGTSIGVCPWSADEPLAVSDLLERADVALYAAKRAGRSRHTVFVPTMLASRGGGERDHVAIRDGLRNGEFELRYQPIVRTRDRALVGFEAFCFWTHPDRGELSAGEFAHLMAHQTVMDEWTCWCLRQLFEHHRERLRQGAPAVFLSQNISAAQFMRLDLAALCNQLASEYATDLDWLCLDLDEQALSASSARAAGKVEALVRCGARINIDHFGRGAILLRQLADLELNALKFSGRELLADAARTDARLAIKLAISQVLKVPVVATQIENLGAADWALAKGIDFIQGYTVSQPLPEDQALRWG